MTDDFEYRPVVDAFIFHSRFEVILFFTGEVTRNPDTGQAETYQEQNDNGDRG